MAIVRFEPFRDLLSIQDRMNHLFDGAFRGVARGAEDEGLTSGSWAPAVDIFEQEDRIVLKAELPGLDPKDVDIRVENNTLTLRGERRVENEVKQEDYRRVERSYGTFSRSFTLPSVVDREHIKAEFQNGVLNLTLPKKAEAKPRQISINVNA